MVSARGFSKGFERFSAGLSKEFESMLYGKIEHR